MTLPLLELPVSCKRETPHYRAPVLRRVLIVSPHFAPVNAPDQHRARMAVVHLQEFGWTAEVLAVAPPFVEAPQDPDLEAALPHDLKVHRVGAIPYRWTRLMGWGSLARRAYGQLRRRGNELLSSGRFNLVFFSTTQFGVLTLGPYWQRKWKIPFVLDFHDEWTGDYYEKNPRVCPPGGRWKHRVTRALARREEKQVVPLASHIISVSPLYNEHLQQRYPRIGKERFHLLPFGGSQADFDVVRRRRFSQKFFRPGEGTHWVYVGRGGPAMGLAARAFFQAWKDAIHRQRAPEDLRVHFIGTDYAVGSRARMTFLPLAREFGLENRVTEETARIPHFAALQCLEDADALLILGSDDPGYTASKLLPCLIAGRPLLGIFHQESSCVRILRETQAGTVVPFSSLEQPGVIARRIEEAWFILRAFEKQPTSLPAALNPYTARAMTQRLATILTAACPAEVLP